MYEEGISSSLMQQTDFFWRNLHGRVQVLVLFIALQVVSTDSAELEQNKEIISK